MSQNTDHLNLKNMTPDVNDDTRNSENDMFIFKCMNCFRVDRKCGTTVINCVNVVSNGDIILDEVSIPRLIIYTKLASRVCELKIQSKPRAIATIDTNTVAVTFGQIKGIVETKSRKSMQLVTEIKVMENCCGLVYLNEKLHVNCEKNGLKVLSKAGKVVSINPCATDNLSLCATKSRTIICAKMNMRFFYSFDTSLFDFKHSTGPCPSMLGANGVTFDQMDIIFVSCCYSRKIYLCNNERKRWMVSIDQNSNIGTPCGVSFDTHSNELVVVTNGGTSVSVFKKKNKKQ